MGYLHLYEISRLKFNLYVATLVSCSALIFVQNLFFDFFCLVFFTETENPALQRQDIVKRNVALSTNYELPKCSSSCGIQQIFRIRVFPLTYLKYPAVPLAVHRDTRGTVVHHVGIMGFLSFFKCLFLSILHFFLLF